MTDIARYWDQKSPKMAGAMLTNSSFARKVQEEIHGRESPSPSLTVYYRGQSQSVREDLVFLTFSVFFLDDFISNWEVKALL